MSDGYIPNPETIEVMTAADAHQPPSEKLGPGEWVRRNLFNSPLNAIITLIFVPVAAYLGYRFFRFVFVTGRWDPVDTNLELFMIGQYPREERWRIVVQILMMSGAGGMAAGLLKGQAKDTALETGEDYVQTSWRTYLASYWALGVFVLVLLLAFVDTPGPWLLTLGSVALAFVGWFVMTMVPGSARPFGWALAGVTAALSFQMLSGTGGWAWFFTSAALIPAITRVMTLVPRETGLPLAAVGVLVGVGTVAFRFGLFGFIVLLIGLYGLFTALQGDRIDGGRVGLFMLCAVAVYFIYRAIGLDGVDWREWGGFHLNLVATVAAILLSFPLGVMLALGRRSDLPVVRYMSVAFVEFFRGAPLITFLLAAQFFLGFFLNSDNLLSLITKAIAALTLFSAAYIAEIIRGGLQAVPKGQIEAGQAQGLSQAKIMRLIVMPQALRAVIPAMVGQFISLWKDTSLLSIISVPELLDVRTLVHGQAEFRGFGIAETLTFVAFGFWAIAFSMSRESQRLERRLGVGQR